MTPIGQTNMVAATMEIVGFMIFVLLLLLRAAWRPIRLPNSQTERALKYILPTTFSGKPGN
jgi:flagellar biogenesis protein FliO